MAIRCIRPSFWSCETSVWFRSKETNSSSANRHRLTSPPPKKSHILMQLFTYSWKYARTSLFEVRILRFQPSSLIEPHIPVIPQTGIPKEQNVSFTLFRSNLCGSPNISTASYFWRVNRSKVFSNGSLMFLKEESVIEYLNVILYYETRFMRYFPMSTAFTVSQVLFFKIPDLRFDM